MSNKSPAFSFYADNYLGGTMRMPPMQRAAYMDLLANQWIGGAFDFATALLVCRGVSEADVRAVIDAKFVCVDGKYLNHRLEQERKKQAEKSEAGRIGGIKSQAGRQAKAKQEAKQTPSKHSSEIQPSVSVSDSDSISNLYSDSHPPNPQGGSEGVGVTRASELKIPQSMHDPEFLRAWRQWIDWHVLHGYQLDAIKGQNQLEALTRCGPAKAAKDLFLTMSSAQKPGRIWDSDLGPSGKPKQNSKQRFSDLETEK